MLADVVEPTDIPKVCRDPDDDEVLAAASAGDAKVIVTGDRDLLDLGRYLEIEIVPPALFVERLKAEEA
ncbi:MAG: putative toxin-antitoxin system toxin component, PIN family [Actinomycetota bacterium]